MSQCPWKIHWGTGLDAITQCARRDGHLSSRAGSMVVKGDSKHQGPTGVIPGQTVAWYAGDRREFTGDWPGYCTKLPGVPLAGGCTLHEGHHGRCAP